MISSTENSKSKKVFLVLSLISNLGVLFVFKYFVFVYNSSIQIFNLEFSLLNQLIIPAGLSFYTFQSLSYTIDVYRGKYKADDKFSDFLLFVSFFPHMVAGPIVRYNELMPKFKIINYFNNINNLSSSEIFPTVSLNFAGSASMLLRPQDYLLQQNSVVNH